jgi:hypothetical protein
MGDKVPFLKAQLEAIWNDTKLRAPFGPIFWHDDPQRYGGYDETLTVRLFSRAGKWTPNKLRRKRKPKP